MFCWALFKPKEQSLNFMRATRIFYHLQKGELVLVGPFSFLSACIAMYDMFASQVVVLHMWNALRHTDNVCRLISHFYIPQKWKKYAGNTSSAHGNIFFHCVVVAAETLSHLVFGENEFWKMHRPPSSVQKLHLTFCAVCFHKSTWKLMRPDYKSLY